MSGKKVLEKRGFFLAFKLQNFRPYSVDLGKSVDVVDLCKFLREREESGVVVRDWTLVGLCTVLTHP